jgi:hypothetical protein
MSRVLTGNDGSTTGFVSKIFAWRGTFSADALPSTGLGQAAETNEYGVGKARGSAMAYVTSDSGSTNDPTTATLNFIKTTITLKCSATQFYQFQAVLSDVEFGVEVDRVQTVTFNWVRDGANTGGGW